MGRFIARGEAMMTKDDLDLYQIEGDQSYVLCDWCEEYITPSQELKSHAGLNLHVDCLAMVLGIEAEIMRASGKYTED
jgi:hypothetical protein